MYTHGTKEGFAAFQQVVTALNENRGDQTIWMKPSEMARYWAAKELTTTTLADSGVSLSAPFACRQFTIRVPHSVSKLPVVTAVGKSEAQELRQVKEAKQLSSGTWLSEADASVFCFDLLKGRSLLSFAG
jgi:hypothetical protein